MAKKNQAAAAPAVDENASMQALEAGETEYEIADPAWVHEQYEEYEEESAERRARGALVKLPEGESSWRIMPPIKGTKRLFFRCWSHAVNNEKLQQAIDVLARLPADIRAKCAKDLGVVDIVRYDLPRGFRTTFCLSKMEDKACLDCALVGVLYRVAKEVAAIRTLLESLAKEFSSKEEYFAGAVRMDKKEEMERGPKILLLKEDVFRGLFDRKSGIFGNPEKGGDFSNPDTGRNILFSKVAHPTKKFTIDGKTFPVYDMSVTPSVTAGPIKDRNWLKHIQDMTKVRDQPDEAAFRIVLEGGLAAGQKEDGFDDSMAAPGSRQITDGKTAVAPAGGGDDDWMEDPENRGDFDTRANLRALGRKV